MSRYIDADKLKKHASHYVRTQPHFHYGDWDNMCISGKEVDEIIDTCPTADVVEVVRCKDCKHCDHCYPLKNKGEEAKEGYYCDYNKRYVKPSGYCSYGERSENGK